jgi:hypothetical protein
MVPRRSFIKGALLIWLRPIGRAQPGFDHQHFTPAAYYASTAIALSERNFLNSIPREMSAFSPEEPNMTGSVMYPVFCITGHSKARLIFQDRTLSVRSARNRSILDAGLRLRAIGQAAVQIKWPDEDVRKTAKRIPRRDAKQMFGPILSWRIT